MKHDLLHIQGKPYVLIPLHEYRIMSAGDPADQTDSDIPPSLLDRLFAAEESPIRILRRHRGLTQQELAKAAGLSRPYLTEIEKGSKTGSLKALRAIARALDVRISLLTGAH